MRKLFLLVVITTLLVVLLPGASFAQRTNQAHVTTLFAGQHIDVGTLSVWNDANYLYVQYDTTAGWELFETHLYVDTEEPSHSIPGQFPYKHEDLGGVTSDLYTIELGPWNPGTVLYIAAHAEVCNEDSMASFETAATVQVVIAEVTLWAGQHIDAGTVIVAVESDDLIVTYQTHDGWEMMATHLYVGLEPPQNSAPGQFPYKHEDLGGVTVDTYVIPLAEIGAGCDDTVYLAAHAELRKLLGHDENGDPIYQEETGWGEGEEFGHGWAMYFWATIACPPPPPPPPPSCETAWAYGPYELPGGSWGWYFDYTVQPMASRRGRGIGLRPGR